MRNNCQSELMILIEAIRAVKDMIVNVRLHTMGYKPSNWSEIARDAKRQARNALDRFNNTECECHHMPLQLPRCQAAKLTAQWISDASDDELWETSGMAIQIQRAPSDFAHAASQVISGIGQFLADAAQMTVTVAAILMMIVLGAFGLDWLVPQH